MKRGGTEGDSHMADTVKSTTDNHATWPQLAEGLYSFLTGRGATIEYAFENMEVQVPRDTTPNAPSALWKINGMLRIRTYEPGTGGK